MRSTVPACVLVPVKAGESASRASSVAAVGPLVAALRNDVPDPASAQVAAVAAGRIRFVGAQASGPGTGVSAAWAGNADAVEDFDHLRPVTPLPRGEQQGERAPAALTGQVDLRRQAAPGAPQGLVRPVPSRAGPLARDCRGALAGAGCVLVDTQDGRVHIDHGPVDPPLCIGNDLKPLQDPRPGAVRRPSAMTAMHRLPLAEPGR